MRLNLNFLPQGRKAQWIGILVAISLIVIVMLWQTGAFVGDKIKPGRTPLPDNASPRLRASARDAFIVQSINLPVIYKAVGTVRSRTEIDLSPRIVARIQEIKVRSGDRVARRLDDAINFRTRKNSIDIGGDTGTTAEYGITDIGCRITLLWPTNTVE